MGSGEVGTVGPAPMQNWPLTVDRIITHAERVCPDVAIVSRTFDGTVRRTGYGEVARQARAVSRALAKAGIGLGDRVATLAWNSDSHVALWYGISGMGAVCHPLNPRFSPDQIAWVINHAADRLLFLDPCFLPLISSIASALPAIERYVVLGEIPSDTRLQVQSLDDFLSEAAEAPTPAWGNFPEETPCALFYTSGTTGDPKGVIYSHRSNLLQAMMLGLGYDFGKTDSIMPVVPMFHANGWGLPYLGPILGVPLIMPGPALDPQSLHALMESEHVTVAAGVPTIWTALLSHLRRSGGTLSHTRRLYSAGAATPAALIEAFAQEHGARVIPAWGMTELSPSGTVGTGVHGSDGAADARQGHFVFGVEGIVTGPDGSVVPADGKSIGTLKVKGATVIRRYAGALADAVDADGWFDTGDLAVVHEDHTIEIADRAKDVIKSGGEWISSIAIEQIAATHPAVELCAVIGVPDERWDERPLLLVHRRAGSDCNATELRDLIAAELPKWWLPDQIEFVDDMPLGATGKIDKKSLRAHYGAIGKKVPADN